MQSQGGIAEGDAAVWTPGDYAHPCSMPEALARLNVFVSDVTIIYGEDIIGGQKPLSLLGRVSWLPWRRW